jgi:lysylphosphatidylglycerol synthetase-like protein (DUF2156 family)
MTTSIIDHAAVHEAVRAFGDNPSGFLALNTGNSWFALPGVPGVVVYRRTAQALVQFGGPFAPPESAGPLLAGFLELAAGQDLAVVAVQVPGADVDRYRSAGFTVNQVGASYAVDLNRFTMAGTRFMRLRNKIARARRAGLTVLEADHGRWDEAVSEIDRIWLAGKGEHAKPLEFLVGERGGPLQTERRMFAGLVEGRPVGYISYSPVYGSRPGWLHDLSRRVPGDLPGILETINSTAIETFRAEGAGWLHFGFTPFSGLSPALEAPGASPGFTWFMHWLWENGSAVYPARTQLAYKDKWAPHAVLPEYIAFHGPARLSSFMQVFTAANAI